MSIFWTRLSSCSSSQTDRTHVRVSNVTQHVSQPPLLPPSPAPPTLPESELSEPERRKLMCPVIIIGRTMLLFCFLRMHFMHLRKVFTSNKSWEALFRLIFSITFYWRQKLCSARNFLCYVRWGRLKEENNVAANGYYIISLRSVSQKRNHIFISSEGKQILFGTSCTLAQHVENKTFDNISCGVLRFIDIEENVILMVLFIARQVLQVQVLDSLHLDLPLVPWRRFGIDWFSS